MTSTPERLGEGFGQADRSLMNRPAAVVPQSIGRGDHLSEREMQR